MKNLDYYLIFNKNQIKQALNEISTSTMMAKNIVDDGPLSSMSVKSFQNQSEEMARISGMKLVNLLIPDNTYIKKDFDRYENGIPHGSSTIYDKSNIKVDNIKPGIEKWKAHVDMIVNRLGFQYVNTLHENITDVNSHQFLNETFNMYGNISFYVTYKNNSLKLARNSSELKTPFNVISIVTENTDELFIDKLIDINNKIEALSDPNLLFEDGNLFLHFRLDNTQLNLINIIDSNNKEIKLDKLNQLSNLF